MNGKKTKRQGEKRPNETGSDEAVAQKKRALHKLDQEPQVESPMPDTPSPGESKEPGALRPDTWGKGGQTLKGKGLKVQTQSSQRVTNFQ
jgi:hypothetical protein